MLTVMSINSGILKEYKEVISDIPVFLFLRMYEPVKRRLIHILAALIIHLMCTYDQEYSIVSCLPAGLLNGMFCTV